MSAISSFKDIENKHDVYGGKNYMKKFCECLKNHARGYLILKRKKMALLTNEQRESYENKKICYIYRKTCEDKYGKYKNLEIIVIILVHIEVLCIAYVI